MNIRLISASALVWLSAAAADAQVRIAAEAFAGRPFGVARVEVDIADALLPDALMGDGLGVSELNGRAFYPVVDAAPFGAIARGVLEATPLLEGGPVRQEVRGILRGILDRPPRRTIYFLFTGDAPLQMTLLARSAHPFPVAVANSPADHARLLPAWWQRYIAEPRFFDPRPDYPTVVEDFLKATLARRLNLELPKPAQTASPRELLEREIALLSGAESILAAMQQNRLLGLHDLELPADQPLPEPLAIPPLALPDVGEVEVEPIAMRVPAECLYIRFGTFANFLWLQDTLARWGGDLQNLVAARGLAQGISQRIEGRLVLQQTALSRLMGDMVIQDVAVIGSDAFFAEGAAFGLLFQARNTRVLGADFARQRLERVDRGGVMEETVKIGDHEISFLHSPDGRVRSYYAVDGDYHFVTSSRHLAERFLQTAEGRGALGASAEFRHARSVMPLARGDTVFIYLSDAFFRNVTSPAYRIETARRLQAQVDIRCVQVAVLAAAAEGKPSGSIEELIAGGLLPPNFGPRPDGGFVRMEKPLVVDSLRGHGGALVPVPDVPITSVSAAEARDYNEFSRAFREHWGRMDPVLVALRREALPQNREQITIEAQFNPFDAKHYETLGQWFGPADDRQMAPVRGNILQFEAVMKQQRIFGGLRDVALPVQWGDARTLHLTRLRDAAVGYLGTTGELGIFGFLERPIPWPADPRGEPVGPLGLVRQRAGEFTVFSLHPQVLAEVMPQLQFQPAPRPAQVRAGIGDVTTAQIAQFANNLGYTRTLDTSRGNLRLLHALEQQLHLPAAHAKDAAEYLLDAKLVCPLGGQYVLRESPQTVTRWTSTAIESLDGRRMPVAAAPPGYLAPPLNWFRGLTFEGAMDEQRLRVYLDVVMQWPAKKPVGEPRKQ
jgi:hypothetical protein